MKKARIEKDFANYDGNFDDEGFNTCALSLTLVENNVNGDEESEDENGNNVKEDE